MDSQRVEATLDEAGVRTNGHFRLNSGLHSDWYYEFDLLTANLKLSRRVSHVVANVLLPLGINAVVGLQTGGEIIGREAAFDLAHRYPARDVRPLFTKAGSDGKTHRLSAQYRRLVQGRQVALVDDVTSTGYSLQTAADDVRSAGGTVVVAVVVVNRDQVSLKDGLRLISLVHHPLQTWLPADCPLCAQGTPLDQASGHGHGVIIGA